MLIIPPPKFRKNRKPPEQSAAVPTPPPVTLDLVSASYDDSALTLTMGFNQPIDISSLDGSQITVDDGEETRNLFAATGSVTMVDPATVSLGLDRITDTSDSGVTMNASDSTGIVASEGGGGWDGVTDLDLPYSD